MNKKQQELFIAFFEEILESELAFEQIKKKMTQCHDFNPAPLFKQVSEGSTALEIPQLRSYLVDKITCSELELYELFSKLDLSRHGYITVEDFAREITPISQRVRPPTQGGTPSVQVQGYFLSLIMEYIKRFRIVEESRKQVYSIEPYRAFQHIDVYKTGLIGPDQLRRFFLLNDFEISSEQTVLLLHGLRRRCYLQINLQVFCESLDPMEFGGYDAYKASIQRQAETQFLRRSRKEEEIMRRSRIEEQKIEHELNKSHRRLRADVERNLDIEDRISDEFRYQEIERERLLRQRILEEDKNIRWDFQTGGSLLKAQKQQYLADRTRNQDLQLLRNQQKDVQEQLARSAALRESELQAGRRLRLDFQAEREAAQRRMLQEQIERDRYEARLKSLRQLDLEKDRNLQVQRLERERNRRLYQKQLQLQREKFRGESYQSRTKIAQYSNVKPYSAYSFQSATKNQHSSASKTPSQFETKSQMRTAWQPYPHNP